MQLGRLDHKCVNVEKLGFQTHKNYSNEVIVCFQVHQYRVAMTAKDCSIMITFAPCGEDDEEYVVL